MYVAAAMEQSRTVTEQLMQCIAIHDEAAANVQLLTSSLWPLTGLKKEAQGL